MTKLLSFAEWLGQQKTDFTEGAQIHCDQWDCVIRDEPKCLSDKVNSCTLIRAYEKQRATDLQRWEKWNQTLEHENNS